MVKTQAIMCEKQQKKMAINKKLMYLKIFH